MNNRGWENKTTIKAVEGLHKVPCDNTLGGHFTIASEAQLTSIGAMRASALRFRPLAVTCIRTVPWTERHV